MVAPSPFTVSLGSMRTQKDGLSLLFSTGHHCDRSLGRRVKSGFRGHNLALVSLVLTGSKCSQNLAAFLLKSRRSFISLECSFGLRPYLSSESNGPKSDPKPGGLGSGGAVMELSLAYRPGAGGLPRGSGGLSLRGGAADDDPACRCQGAVEALDDF